MDYHFLIGAGSTNSNLRIVANQHCVGDFFSIHLSRVAEPKAPKIIPPYGVDAGNTFGGCNPTKHSGLYVFSNWKNRRERKRSWLLLVVEHHQVLNQTIDFISIQVHGNSLRFGDLSHLNKGDAGETRSVFWWWYFSNHGINIGQAEDFEITFQINQMEQILEI